LIAGGFLNPGALPGGHCISNFNGGNYDLIPEITPVHDQPSPSAMRVVFQGPLPAGVLLDCLRRSVIFSLGSNPDVGRVDRTYHFVYTINTTDSVPEAPAGADHVVVSWSPLARECHGLDLTLPDSPPHASFALPPAVPWPTGSGCGQPAPPVDAFGPLYVLPNPFVDIEISPDDPLAAVTSVTFGGCVDAVFQGTFYACGNVPVGESRSPVQPRCVADGWSDNQ
jgi:hypothetical protein